MQPCDSPRERRSREREGMAVVKEFRETRIKSAMKAGPSSSVLELLSTYHCCTLSKAEPSHVMVRQDDFA